MNIYRQVRRLSIKIHVQATAPTYVDEAVYKRVVAGVAHCQAVTAQPDDVDVSVPAQYKRFIAFQLPRSLVFT